MNIPEDVIEKAAKAQYEWQDGLPSWESDADGFTKAEYLSQTHAAAQVIAEWARAEALREAAEAAESDQFWDDRGDALSSDEVAYNTGRREAADAIRALAEGTPERGN
jgi:hypothetical protein